MSQLQLALVDKGNLIMSKPTLLVLAAGMGSRYGGLKQLDPVGPSGEVIIDYSIYDTIRAGFGKVVFVIRRDIEDAFKKVIGTRYENEIEIEYAYQELTSIPDTFTGVPLNTEFTKSLFSSKSAFI